MSTYHSYISTLDAAAGSNILDYSPMMFATPAPGGDVALWPLLQKAADLTDTTCYWMESSRVPIYCTADSSNYLTDGSATRLDLTTGDAAAKFITTGTLLRDRADGSDEIVLVTGVSTDTLTVSRNWNGVGAETTHAASAVWEVVGHLNYEGSAFGTPVGRVPVRRSNTTAILDEQVRMTGTDAARQYYAIPNYWEWQVAGGLERFMRKMERMVIWSAGVARADTANVYGSFSGIKDIIMDRAGDAYDSSFGDFTYAAWDDAIKTLWENGYSDGRFVMLIPPTGLQQCAYIHESAFRGDYRGELVRGLRATALQSTLGPEIPLIPSTAIKNDEFLILDLSRIKVRFMAGRELIGYDIPMGEAGADLKARRLISELSMEIHNADVAHYWARGVTFAVPS